MISPLYYTNHISTENEWRIEVNYEQKIYHIYSTLL